MICVLQQPLHKLSKYFPTVNHWSEDTRHQLGVPI